MYKNISDCKHAIGKNKDKAIIIRGKNRISVIAACIIFACRKKDKTRSPKEIAEIETKIINLYKSEAEKFEKTNKNALALKVYERLAKAVKDSEKPEIKKKVLVLYKKLGKVRESIELERELQR